MENREMKTILYQTIVDAGILLIFKTQFYRFHSFKLVPTLYQLIYDEVLTKTCK